MKRSLKILLVAFLLVILGVGGLFAAYKGYRKYQARQYQEFKYEGALGRAPNGFKPEMFREFVLADEILDDLIEAKNLVDVWGCVDVEAAKKHIRAKFIVTMEDSVVRVSYQDKNQQVAHDILQAIIQSYRQKMDEAGRLQKAVPDDA